MSEQAIASEQSTAGGWRIKAGAAILFFGIAVQFIGVPVVMGLGLSAAMTASITGALLVSGEISTILAVAVMGKPGYAYLKNRVFGVLTQYGPPEEVSRLRYKIGLVMFCAPIIFGWVSLYFADRIPGFMENPLPYAVGGDLVLVVSLFVLGGNFWDKIRSLFVYDSEARFSQG